MLTPFGVEVRKLRLDKGLRLLDLAAKLRITPAFLSAIETGRKPAPDNLVASVAKAMNLTQPEILALTRAADRSRTTVRVEQLPGAQRELVAAFARKVDDLPEEFLADLKKIVFKSGSGEIPFKRNRKGLLVSPASAKSLREFSEIVRNAFVEPDQIEFPIMDVLEYRLSKFFEGFYLDVCSSEEMDGEEGRVVSGQNYIMLREDVYVGAWKNNGRDRFTACHEMAHFLLHRDVRMARTRDDSHPIYRDAEWQADTFAGSLLMSSRHLGRLAGPITAADCCGMTPAAAKVMWSKYQREGLI